MKMLYKDIAEVRTARDPAEWWGSLYLIGPQAHVYTCVSVVTSSGAFRKRSQGMVVRTEAAPPRK